MEASGTAPEPSLTDAPALELWRALPVREGWAFEVVLEVTPGQEIAALDSATLRVDGEWRSGVVRELSTRSAPSRRLWLVIIDLPGAVERERSQQTDGSPLPDESLGRVPAPLLSELRLNGRLDTGQRFSWRYADGRGEAIEPLAGSEPEAAPRGVGDPHVDEVADEDEGPDGQRGSLGGAERR
jgi:hypothetical protein